MKIKIITVATREDEGLEKLKESCKKFNLDLEVLGMGTQWKGFGTKVILTGDYLNTLEGYTHFMFVDAYDVIIIGDNIEEKYKEFGEDAIVFSAEKCCWPKPDLAKDYPIYDIQWRYLNSGSYIAPIEKYLRLLDKNPPTYAMDDQLYFTELFLKGEDILLDTHCKLFQSIAFEHDTDFKLTDTYLINRDTNTRPLVLHGNGKTTMDKYHNLLKYGKTNE